MYLLRVNIIGYNNVQERSNKARPCTARGNGCNPRPALGLGHIRKENIGAIRPSSNVEWLPLKTSTNGVWYKHSSSWIPIALVWGGCP